MAEPINFLGLIDEVVDEDSAIQFLQNDGLLHENRHCPRQDHVMGLNKRSRKFGGDTLLRQDGDATSKGAGVRSASGVARSLRARIYP